MSMNNMYLNIDTSTLPPISYPDGIIKEYLGQSLNLGFRTFSWETVSGPTEEGQKVWGLTDFDHCRIILDDKMTGDLAEEVIIHEACHAMLGLLGLDDLPIGKVREITNEELTTLVSRGILMLFKLNPGLLRYLHDRITGPEYLPQSVPLTNTYGYTTKWSLGFCEPSKPNSDLSGKPEILSD